MSTILDPTRGSLLSRFIRGGSYLVSAFGALTKGALLRYAVMPIAINLVLLVGLVVAVFFLTDDVLGLFWSSPTDGWVALYWLAMALVWLVLLVLAYGLFIVLSGVVAGPFNDRLSERAEALELGKPVASEGKGLVSETAGALGSAIKALLFFVLISFPLLLLNLIPVIGSILYAILGGGTGSFFAAMDFIDGPASRREYSHRQKVRTVTGNLALFMGFGAAVSACLLVPFLNLLVLPAAVVGGTRLFIHLEAHHKTGAFGLLLAASIALFTPGIQGCGSNGDNDTEADTRLDQNSDSDSDTCPVDPALCAREPGILQRNGSEVRLLPAPIGGESFGYYQVSNGSPADSGTIIIVDQVLVEGSPYISVSDSEGDPPPFALEPGQSSVIALRLAPDASDYQCPTATADPDYCGEMSIFHNDSLNSPARIPIRVDTSSGVLEVSPTSVLFNDTLNDQEATISLRNIGFGSLEIIDARFASPVEGLSADGPPIPVQLGPTETTEWVIRYAPVELGGGIGTLRFQTSSPVTSEAVVVAQVGGIGFPRIELSQETLDLRGAGPGRQVTRTLTISNTGSEETLQIAPSILPGSAAQNFTVTENGQDVLGGLIGIQAQRSTELEITHAPTGDVSDATLFLETNDPVSPEVEVELLAL